MWWTIFHIFDFQNVRILSENLLLNEWEKTYKPGYHIWLLSLFSYIDSRFYLFQNGWVADIYTGKLDLDQDLEKIDRLVGNLSLMADQKNNLKGRCIWLFNLYLIGFLSKCCACMYLFYKEKSSSMRKKNSFRCY